MRYILILILFCNYRSQKHYSVSTKERGKINLMLKIKKSIILLILILSQINCISYYTYKTEPIQNKNININQKIKAKRLSNVVSFSRKKENDVCIDIFEDYIEDDENSEISVNLKNYIISTEPDKNIHLQVLHLGFSLGTLGVIPFKSEFICEYELEVFRKNKLIHNSNDEYKEKNYFTIFFIFLLPFRDKSEGPEAIENLKKRNLILFNEAIKK